MAALFEFSTPVACMPLTRHPAHNRGIIDLIVSFFPTSGMRSVPGGFGLSGTHSDDIN
jgi:hypothetical protein